MVNIIVIVVAAIVIIIIIVDSRCAPRFIYWKLSQKFIWTVCCVLLTRDVCVCVRVQWTSNWNSLFGDTNTHTHTHRLARAMSEFVAAAECWKLTIHFSVCNSIVIELRTYVSMYKMAIFGISILRKIWPRKKSQWPEKSTMMRKCDSYVLQHFGLWNLFNHLRLTSYKNGIHYFHLVHERGQAYNNI